MIATFFCPLVFGSSGLWIKVIKHQSYTFPTTHLGRPGWLFFGGCAKKKWLKTLRMWDYIGSVYPIYIYIYEYVYSKYIWYTHHSLFVFVCTFSHLQFLEFVLQFLSYVISISVIYALDMMTSKIIILHNFSYRCYIVIRDIHEVRVLSKSDPVKSHPQRVTLQKRW